MKLVVERVQNDSAMKFKMVIKVASAKYSLMTGDKIEIELSDGTYDVEVGLNFAKRRIMVDIPMQSYIKVAYGVSGIEIYDENNNRMDILQEKPVVEEHYEEPFCKEIQITDEQQKIAVVETVEPRNTEYVKEEPVINNVTVEKRKIGIAHIISAILLSGIASFFFLFFGESFLMVASCFFVGTSVVGVISPFLKNPLKLPVVIIVWLIGMFVYGGVAEYALLSDSTVICVALIFIPIVYGLSRFILRVYKLFL